MRGVTANQDDIRDEVAALIAAARALPPDSSPWEIPTALSARAHVVANAFGRINTLYEQLQTQNATPSVGLYTWYTALGRQVLRTAAPNSMDRVMHHGLRTLLMASVHSNALDIRLSDAARAGHPLNRERVGKPVARYLDQAWAEGLMKANSSDFYKVRAAALVLLLEGMLLSFKATELPEGDARVIAQMSAAGLTTVAAGIELGASYVEQVVARYGPSSVSGRGAEAVLGRLKLWGAAFAGVGGMILAWWDFSDGDQHRRETGDSNNTESRGSSRLLAGAYYARALATTVLSVAEIATAIAIAKPLFGRLANNAKGTMFRTLALGMSQLASKLGTEAARLILSRVLLGAFWVGLAFSLVIWILDDDELEKWCKRSTYRWDPKNSSYADEKELPELFKALKGVI